MMLPTWILILTVASASYGGVSIDHVPGFTTAADCVSAGNVWLQYIQREAHGWGYSHPLATCVKAP